MPLSFTETFEESEADFLAYWGILSLSGFSFSADAHIGAHSGQFATGGGGLLRASHHDPGSTHTWGFDGWIKVPAVQSDTLLIELRSNDLGGYLGALTIGTGAGSLVVRVQSGTALHHVDATLTDGAWHHVVWEVTVYGSAAGSSLLRIDGTTSTASSVLWDDSGGTPVATMDDVWWGGIPIGPAVGVRWDDTHGGSQVCLHTWETSEVILPNDQFESYAGSGVALAAIYDVFGTPLDNATGDPHAGNWCAKFGHDEFLNYPKGTWDGTGLARTLFDATFWLAHNAPRVAGSWDGPGFVAEKVFLVLEDGAGHDTGCYVAITEGGWNLAVVSGWTSNKYTTPVDSLPGDGTYRKLRIQINLEGTPLGPFTRPAIGSARIWINDVLTLDVSSVALTNNTGTYAGTYGGLSFQGGSGAGFTYFRLDDVNTCPPLLVAARARCWEVL